MNSVYCKQLLETLKGIKMRYFKMLEYIGFGVVAVVISITYGWAQQQPQKPVEINQQEIECMAVNIYHESQNQSKLGMIAVARVVMNRVYDRRFPETVCGVIYEGPVIESWKTRDDPNLPDEERIYYPQRDRCQFSWYCDGKPDEIISKKNNIAWRIAQDVAIEVLAFDKYNGIVEGATHYHADYVDPAWNKTITLVTKVDDHIFYRWD
jgi:spore germination cell wall hydrolase CwlJ-like protein